MASDERTVGVLVSGEHCPDDLVVVAFHSAH
jgi:hypothetical protein